MLCHSWDGLLPTTVVKPATKLPMAKSKGYMPFLDWSGRQIIARFCALGSFKTGFMELDSRQVDPKSESYDGCGIANDLSDVASSSHILLSTSLGGT